MDPFVQQTDTMFTSPTRAPQSVEKCGGFTAWPPRFFDTPPIKRWGSTPPLKPGFCAYLTGDCGRRLFGFCVQTLRSEQFPLPVSWGHSPLEPRSRAVKEPTLPRGESQVASAPPGARGLSHAGEDSPAPGERLQPPRHSHRALPRSQVHENISDCCAKPPSFVAKTRRQTHEQAIL